MKTLEGLARKMSIEGYENKVPENVRQQNAELKLSQELEGILWPVWYSLSIVSFLAIFHYIVYHLDTWTRLIGWHALKPLVVEKIREAIAVFESFDE